MKREELKALGLSDEQIGDVMAMYGKTVTGLNTQVNELESERDQFKEQLATNQTELDTLKEAAKGNGELTQQLADLQAKYDETKTETDTKLAEQKKDFAIKLALKEASALDEDIVLGQLNTETIQLTDKGLLGLDEQLKGLQESKAFLFQQEEQKAEPTPSIVPGGNKNTPPNVEQDPFDEKLAKYN